jgi:hypothetical protein
MQAVMPGNTGPKSTPRSKSGISVPVLHTVTPRTVASKALEGECALATQMNGHTSNDAIAHYADQHMDPSCMSTTSACMASRQSNFNPMQLQNDTAAF